MEDEKEKPFLTKAQEGARAKRCKTYLDKVRSIRANWQDGDEFVIPSSDKSAKGNAAYRGFYRFVECLSDVTTFPYRVIFDGHDGKRRYCGTSRFADGAVKVHKLIVRDPYTDTDS